MSFSPLTGVRLIKEFRENVRALPGDKESVRNKEISVKRGSTGWLFFRNHCYVLKVFAPKYPGGLSFQKNTTPEPSLLLHQPIKIISLFHLPILEVDPAMFCKLQLLRGSFPRDDASSCLAILEGICFLKKVPLSSLEVPAVKRRLLSRYSSIQNVYSSKFTIAKEHSKNSSKPPQRNYRAISQIHNFRHIPECLRNDTVYSNSMKDTICKIGNFVRIYFWKYLSRSYF